MEQSTPLGVKKTRRASLLVLFVYLLQLFALGPIHSQETTLPEFRAAVSGDVRSGPAITVLTSGHGIPCSKPGEHKHRPLPAHNETSCPVCGVVAATRNATGEVLPALDAHPERPASFDDLPLTRDRASHLPSRAPPLRLV